MASAHGLQGALTVVPLTDFPERFQAMRTIALYRGTEALCTLEVRGVRFDEGRNLLTLQTNLSTREEAEACVGASILIDQKERVELPRDSFWVDDLIGLAVEDLEGRPLGTVTDFLTGANELYEIRDAAGGLHYIPAVREFVRDIDLEGGRLKIALIEGLWD